MVQSIPSLSRESTPLQNNDVLDFHKSENSNILSMQEYRQRQSEIAEQTALAKNLAETAIADQTSAEPVQPLEQVANPEIASVRYIKGVGPTLERVRQDARDRNWDLRQDAAA